MESVCQTECKDKETQENTEHVWAVIKQRLAGISGTCSPYQTLEQAHYTRELGQNLMKASAFVAQQWVAAATVVLICTKGKQMARLSDLPKDAPLSARPSTPGLSCLLAPTPKCQHQKQKEP